MSVFNPNILDASIHALTTSLRDEQKADVLLYASRYLPLEGSVPSPPSARPRWPCAPP